MKFFGVKDGAVIDIAGPEEDLVGAGGAIGLIGAAVDGFLDFSVVFLTGSESKLLLSSLDGVVKLFLYALNGFSFLVLQFYDNMS